MSHIDATHDEIKTFLRSLAVELEIFQSTTKQVLESDIAAIKKRDGQIVGIGGLKDNWMMPTIYCVVGSRFYGQGYGFKIAKETVEYARRKYPFLIAVILTQNSPAIRICLKLGFKPCLINYNYRFLFLPLRGWSYLHYLVYAVIFPPLWYLCHFAYKSYWVCKGFHPKKNV